MADMFEEVEDLYGEILVSGLSGSAMVSNSRLIIDGLAMEWVLRCPMVPEHPLLLRNVKATSAEWAESLPGLVKRAPAGVVVEFSELPPIDQISSIGEVPGVSLLLNGWSPEVWEAMKPFAWERVRCVVDSTSIAPLLFNPLPRVSNVVLLENPVCLPRHRFHSEGLNTTARQLAAALALEPSPKFDTLRVDGDLRLLLPYVARLRTRVLRLANVVLDGPLLVEVLLGLAPSCEEFDLKFVKLDASSINHLKAQGLTLKNATVQLPPDPQPIGLPLSVSRASRLQKWLVISREPLSKALEAAGVASATITEAIASLGEGEYTPRTSSDIQQILLIRKSVPSSDPLYPKLGRLCEALAQFGVDAQFHDSRWALGTSSEDELRWEEIRREALLDPRAAGRDVSSSILHLVPPDERDALRDRLKERAGG